MNEDQKNHTLVVAGNSSLLWALKILINSIHKDKDVQVILHGTLASLSSRKSLRLNKRLWDLRTALKMFNHKRIQYIVLEESIRNAVLQKLPSLRRFLSVFDHPIPLDEEAKGNSVLKPPVRFGFLGLANENKGFLTYLKVASEISTKFPGLAEFHVVGRLDNQYRDMHIPEIASLHTKPSIERLSRDEYIQALRKIHFVCLFYEGRHYEFSPSGALLDGIAWEKPVIASQMPIFKSLEQKFGDIGYLCKKGEFTKTIGTLLKDMDVQRYNRQILNIRNVKRARTPEILARKYRDIVELSKCGRMVKAADSGLCKA
ncbi:MAG: glycosyltransferase [Nitrospirae bacterium]|nr:glycosyltransferase [Nitrospirota bacterium]